MLDSTRLLHANGHQQLRPDHGFEAVAAAGGLGFETAALLRRRPAPLVPSPLRGRWPDEVGLDEGFPACRIERSWPATAFSPARNGAHRPAPRSCCGGSCAPVVSTVTSSDDRCRSASMWWIFLPGGLARRLGRLGPPRDPACAGPRIRPPLTRRPPSPARGEGPRTTLQPLIPRRHVDHVAQLSARLVGADLGRDAGRHRVRIARGGVVGRERDAGMGPER
jgi:hypothetical protein